MNRRSFLASIAASASALVLPWEPKRVYSFMPGRLWEPEWMLVERWREEPGIRSGRVLLAQIEAQQLKLHERWARDMAFYSSDGKYLVNLINPLPPGSVRVFVGRAEE